MFTVASILSRLCQRPTTARVEGPPREGAELAPLQISKHMQLSRVTFLFRMLGVSYACVTCCSPHLPPSPRLYTTPNYHLFTSLPCSPLTAP